MSQPTIEILPLRPALRSDAPTTLDVLIRVTPPSSDANITRPAINLGLVIDRSGSMSDEQKLSFAKEAAAFAVKELLPADRVSLTVFDDNIDTLAVNAPAADRARLLSLIAGIYPGGGTALHGGWAEGAKQVGDNLISGGLNRVLLLSDGLANVGESRPDAIATDVHTRRSAGVSTSTLGLGNEYNEDLLEAMARSGDGNYYYVESPRQLATIFQTELSGLTATVGTNVTLALDPGAGVVIAEVLNELDRAPDGRLMLPNLVSGFPVLVVVRFVVPPTTGEIRVFGMKLEWDAPGAGHESAATGLTLPAVGGAAWDSLMPDLEVQERGVLLAVARIKKAVSDAIMHGNVAGAKRLLAEARAMLATIPPTPEVGIEIQSLAELDARVEQGDFVGTMKFAKHGAYLRQHSKPYTPPPDAT